MAKDDGDACIEVLWDMRKFYDTIRLEPLADQLTVHGYPPFFMAMGMTMHRSPRVHKVGGGHSAV